MLTVNYGLLLYRFCQLAGLDRANITSQDFAMFRDLANGRLKMIWEAQAWPDLIRTSTPPGETVNTDANGVRTVTLPVDTDEVLSVYNSDPRLNTRARLVKYFIYNDSTARYINIMEAADPIFIEYSIKRPALFGDAYSATATYSVGSQIYFDTSTNSGSFQPGAGKLPAGNFYTCLIATTAGQSPFSNSANWSIIEIPDFTGEYLVRSCLADYLRGEGQYEQAMAAEADAETTKQNEADKILRAEGQIRRLSVFTY